MANLEVDWGRMMTSGVPYGQENWPQEQEVFGHDGSFARSRRKSQGGSLMEPSPTGLTNSLTRFILWRSLGFVIWG